MRKMINVFLKRFKILLKQTKAENMFSVFEFSHIIFCKNAITHGLIGVKPALLQAQKVI